MKINLNELNSTAISAAIHPRERLGVARFLRDIRSGRITGQRAEQHRNYARRITAIRNAVKNAV